MFKEFVLGFDCREMWLPYSTIWHGQDVDHLLLRRDIEKPLSTDRTVWPSIFRSYIFVSGVEKGTIPETGLELPIEYRTSENLWDNLQAMQTHLRGEWKEPQKTVWTIALTVLQSRAHDQLLLPSGIHPSEANEKWQFLGYDVSDASAALWSGLLGYTPGEIQTVREDWGKYLNKYHLFTDQQQSSRFADWADSRDSGHAPYYVYGLYLIQRLYEK